MRLHTLEPAYSIIKGFARNGEDGITRIARIIGRSRDAVKRWTYPKRQNGTGGGVPRRHYPALQAAAQAEGRVLTLEQLAREGDESRGKSQSRR